MKNRISDQVILAVINAAKDIILAYIRSKNG